jgi:hypothetical protein
MKPDNDQGRRVDESAGVAVERAGGLVVMSRVGSRGRTRRTGRGSTVSPWLVTP